MPKALSFQNRIRMKFGRDVLQINVHQLSQPDFLIWCHTCKMTGGGHGVILHNKVLPPELTRSICRCLCCSVFQFLIYCTVVLVCFNNKIQFYINKDRGSLAGDMMWHTTSTGHSLCDWQLVVELWWLQHCCFVHTSDAARCWIKLNCFTL